MFEPIDPHKLQQLQTSGRVSAIWLTNLENFMVWENNSKSSKIGMKAKGVIKLKYAELVKSKGYPEKKVLPKDALY